MECNDVSIQASKVYRMSASSFARAMFRRFAPWWMWTVIAAGVVAIIVGFMTDLRWSVVGFMLILVILPPALAFVYYSHALCRECFINTMPHTVAVQHNMLTVMLYVHDDEQEDKDAMKPLRAECFGPQSLVGWSQTPDGDMVELADTHRGFLWIMPGCWDDDSEYARFVHWVKNGLN